VGEAKETAIAGYWSIWNSYCDDRWRL
jgi:hypothetical protein